MAKFQIRKVFDCQDMPDDVRKAFFRHTNRVVGNNVYVSYVVGYPHGYPDPDPTPEVAGAMKDKEAVDNWLLGHRDDNWRMFHGADDEEEVIIKRWW